MSELNETTGSHKVIPLQGVGNITQEIPQLPLEISLADWSFTKA